MTLMLASVTGAAEAEAVLAGGVDIVDLKDPAKGALGALDVEVVADIVRTVAKRRPVSATIGDKLIEPRIVIDAVSAMAATGVDYVKVGIKSDATGADCVRALGSLASNARLVGVLFADGEPDLDLLKLMAKQGFVGAMLDTAIKGDRRLLDHMDVASLAGFVERCKEAGLMSGLAGSLEAPDVPRLLPLQPNYLGFRGALCRGRSRVAEIDPAAVRIIRDLIPREANGVGAAGEPTVDWRLLLGRGYVPVNERGAETDRVFVHDLVMPCSIGAYDFERGLKQDVRFNIDVDVRRLQHHSDDMRYIFSYDLIVDAIKIILGRGHIDLIETLARDIADAVLHHPCVAQVSVRVEKLDVIRGQVGVEIKRERAAESLAVEKLFLNEPGVASTTRSR
jgi:FolB domain-containing protein